MTVVDDQKESFMNHVLVDMQDDLEPKQLQRLQVVLTLDMKKYRVEEERNEVIIYDESSDIAAYKQYVVSKKIAGLSDNTIDQYMRTITAFMRATRKSFKEITTQDIRLFIANRLTFDHLSNNSIVREQGIVTRFFKWLNAEGYIPTDPGARVERIKREKRIKTAFEEIEVEKLRAACTSLKQSAVIELLLSTGCRVTELTLLTFDNMNFEKGEIRVIGKGNKERIVYLNAKAKFALSRYLEKYPHEGYLIQGRYKDRPMTKSGIEKMINDIAARAGVMDAYPHRFRRTSATIAMKHDMPIQLIKEFLGHSSIDTTLLYALVGKDELRLAHEKYIN